MEVDDLQLAYSLRWEDVKYMPTHINIGEAVGKPLTDKQTDIKMMRDPLYRELMENKRTLKKLSRYRSDLNRKLDILMGIRRKH